MGGPCPKTWGFPDYFLHPKSYFFCELGAHAKFNNPRTTPSGRKVCDPKVINFC